jgi:hypothetical protein
MRTENNCKTYLIYCDILGFKNLPSEISRETGFNEDTIRQTFFSDPLKKEIYELEKDSLKISKGISEIEGSDNYVLSVDNLNMVYKILGKLTTIKIPHERYEYIPIEIAIDVTDIVEQEVDLINQRTTIDFLKTNIINSFKISYKEKYGLSVKKTFVLFTDNVHSELSFFDKESCNPINFQNNIFYSYAVERINQKKMIASFLDKIGRKDSKHYQSIYDLYVPPQEYQEIRSSLKKERIVFITGSPEYGKTYTAIRLLWEYFNEGYEPRWIKGEEEKQRVEVREKLEEIETELKPNHIIYFEDPFGKVTYEEKYDLERGIGRIIDYVRKVNNAYVLITSREEIFKVFKKENLSLKSLKDFEIKLNIKKPSYDHNQRLQMLALWAKAEDCKWILDIELREFIFSHMTSVRTLPTPLSIRDFAVSTKNVTNKGDLKKLIWEKSEETAKSFAKEIESMTDDKMLFLSLLLITKEIEKRIMRELYSDLVRDLNVRNALNFDRVVNWFRDDKIEIYLDSDDKEYVIFSHPSYSKALKYLLISYDDFHTHFNKNIFNHALYALYRQDISLIDIAEVIITNYDLIEQKAKDLLLDLMYYEDAADLVVLYIESSFSQISQSTRNVLLQLAKQCISADNISLFLEDNINWFPNSFRNSLLLKLSKCDSSALRVANILFDNFNNLDKIDKDKLLINLSKRGSCRVLIADFLYDNFKKVKEDVRDLMLIGLAQTELGSQDVIDIIATYRTKVSNRSIINLMKSVLLNGRYLETFTIFLLANYDIFEEKFRSDFLLKLAESEGAVDKIASFLDVHFDKLSQSSKVKLILTIAEKSHIALQFFERHFEECSENDKDEILLKLSNNYHSPVRLVAFIEKNLLRISETIRTNLLIKLHKNVLTKDFVETVIRENENLLPDTLRHLIE